MKILKKNSSRVLLNFFTAMVILIATAITQQASFAQNNDNATKQTGPEYYRELVNKGTVGIISGGIAGTYINIATDLASVLDDEEGLTLRILPIAGKAGEKNIRDLLYMKGIDIAIVQSDVFGAIEEKNTFRNIRNRVHYITKLYDAELHIIANKSIKNIRDLNGKIINFWQKGTSTESAGRVVLKQYGVEAEIIFIDQNLAIDKVSKGEIAATALMVGRPVKRYAAIPADANVHFLPIEYKDKLAQNYLPAHFGNQDYPNLIPKGQTITTISTAAVLAVYNWPVNHPRYEKVVRFIDQFFTNFEQFQKPPRHEKWRDVNLAAELKGWIRFRYADEWLKGRRAQKTNTTEESFKQFLRNEGVAKDGAAKLSEDQQELLFERFLNWQKSARR